MKKYLRYKIFLTLSLSVLLNVANAQTSITQEEKNRDSLFKIRMTGSMCGTMNLPENRKIPESFDNAPLLLFKPNLRRSGQRNNNWNVSQGYGGSCTNDCIMSVPTPCSDPTNSKFRIPVVFTVSNNEGCSGSAIPTQSAIDNQLAIMNDLYACEGVPIVFYKSVSYNGHPTTGDMSTRYLPLGCTYSAGNVADVPNVFNVYIFANTGYSTGCNGFAYLPTGPGAPISAVISRACISGFTYTKGTLNCSTPNLGLGIVLVHETGHFLGLHHTHNGYEYNGGNPQGARTECPDGSNCCTSGDYICDTSADPDLSSPCAGNGSCSTNTPNNCTSPCGTPYPSNINTVNNIMCYNNSGSCRNQYTPCQNAKMVDALLCARGPQLCDRNIAAEFGTNPTSISICIGGTAPTFTATSNCYKWMGGLGSSATQLSSGTASFTPSIGTGANQLNNQVPGTYTWYLADINEINPNCRTAVQVIVLPAPGEARYNATNNPVNLCTGNTFSFTTNGASFSNNQQMTGWLFSTDNPTLSTTPTAITNIINSSTNGIALNPSTGNVIQSNSGTPLTSLNNLVVNCTSLTAAGGDGTYFLTPFVASGDSPINCSALGNSSALTWNTTPPSGGATVKVGPLNGCSVSGMTLSNYTVTLNVMSCSNPGTTVGCRIYRNCGSSLSIGTPFNLTFSCSQQSIILTKAQIEAIHPTFNPLIDHLCFNFINSNFSGALSLDVSVQIAATFIGNSALQLWNSNAKPTVNANAGSCFWGTPIQLNCVDPIANITINESSGSLNNDGFICRSANVALNASGGSTYMWNNAASSTTINVTSTSTYTVTVSTAGGCKNSTSTTIYVESQSVSNQNNSGPGSLRDIFDCQSAVVVISYQSGTGSNMTAPLTIAKNMTIQGNGIANTSINFNMAGGSGLTIMPGSTLTLKDIKVTLTGSTDPVINNQGTLILNNSEIAGHSGTLNVIQNTSSATISVQNTSTVKK